MEAFTRLDAADLRHGLALRTRCGLVAVELL